MAKTIDGYELLATGGGQRLERWCGRVIRRPETAATWAWTHDIPLPDWDGVYHGTRASGGRWEWRNPLPDAPVVRHKNLSFLIKPTTSKHLGLFPEQASNWDWITSTLPALHRSPSPTKVLNLFGYTGGATLAAAAAGASVTHVDSSKAMVSWCSHNALLSGLGKAPIRYIVEDAMTFLQREIRRGNRYNAIIMDPPAFGRGKGGELWKLSDHLPFLIDIAQEALSENPLFLLLNTYSESVDDLAESMISKRFSRLGGSFNMAELVVTGSLDRLPLPLGKAHRWKSGP
jgi:23S rRNA (cytosine1962-C5)-methyltransferase